MCVCMREREERERERERAGVALTLHRISKRRMLQSRFYSSSLRFAMATNKYSDLKPL